MSTPETRSEELPPGTPAAPRPPGAPGDDAHHGPEKFWPLVWEALRGSRRDLTVMPMRRAILLLAVPMVLEMMSESLFAVTDIFWASKLGPEAVVVVGVTESFMTIVYALSMALAMGVGAV